MEAAIRGNCKCVPAREKIGGGRATQLATINNAVKIPEVQIPQLACVIQHDHGTVILHPDILSIKKTIPLAVTFFIR